MNQLKTTFLFAVALSSLTLFGAENLVNKATQSTAHPYNDKVALSYDNVIKTSWCTYTIENAEGFIQFNYDESIEFQAVMVLGTALHEGTLSVSNDGGKTWQDAGAFKNSHKTRLSFFSKTPITANAIKINLIGGPEKVATLAREISIYNVDDSENLAIFASVKETAVEAGLNWMLPADYIADGNKDTSCKTYSIYKGSTLEFDLGEEVEVSSIQLKSYNKYQTMKVYIANSDKNYTELKSVVAPEDSRKAITLEKKKVQYIKFDVVGTGYPIDLIVK